MITYASYSEYPLSATDMKESPDGIYVREWNTKHQGDPLDNITLNDDGTSFRLKEGVYRVTGQSSLTMMTSLNPIFDSINSYPGCCYVYDAARWPKIPGPHDADFLTFMEELYAVGSLAVAMYSGISTFECMVQVGAAGTSIAVAHQCGYKSGQTVNKVYVRVGGGDSTYHQAAKISIYQVA